MSCMNFRSTSLGLRCIMLVVVSNVAVAILGSRGIQNSDVFPAIFNFGDSNSDTGSTSAAFGRAPYPNGMTFFGVPSGRSSDGRLIIDFIAEKLGMPHISAYLDAMEANFKHGANFAACGTTISTLDAMYYGHGAYPFPLNSQILQFEQFKNRVHELYKKDETSQLENRLLKPEEFSRALYTIDMGQNDIDQVIEMGWVHNYESHLVQTIDSFGLSIEQLYELGARRFLIHNTGPYGCLPMFIQKSFASNNRDNYDEVGCVKSYNEIAQQFNRLLKDKVSLLQLKLQDSSLVYVDIYSVKYSLIKDAKLYGFNDPLLGYCCKDCMDTIIMPYWTRTVSNEISVETTCDDPSKYISWDGVHYTEAANHLIVSQIFDGSSNDPLVNLSLNHLRVVQKPLLLLNKYE